MAYEEDLNKRREQREALRQQRLAEHRQLVTRLVIAGVILVLCAVLIAVVALRSPEPPDTTQTTTLPAQTGETSADTEPGTTTPEETEPLEGTTGTTEPPETGDTTVPTEMEETTVIHFGAAGDININDTTAALDFEQAFQDILPLLSAADLTAVNFEGNLIGEPYGSASQSAPQSLMTALNNAGVDLVQMANSKTITNGLPGLSTTLSAIRSTGMESVGAWATAEEAQQAGGCTILEVNGIRVAIVAFTKGMDSMALPSGSEDCVNLLYNDYATTYKSVDTDGITAILERVAEDEPDITIALVHWGSEFRDQVSSTQKTIRDLMLSLGVDAIIGTHPHYVQAVEFNPEAGTLVAYSLGDLLSDGETTGTEYSIVLDLEITKDNYTGETKITGCSYTPIFNVRQEGEQIRLVRLDDAIRAYEEGYMLRVSEDIYDDMVYAKSRVEARVQPDE